jgi:hypothetical protein
LIPFREQFIRCAADRLAMEPAVIWLRTNRRALAFGAVPPALSALLGAYLLFAVGPSASVWWRWIGGVVLAIGLFSVLALMLQFRAPRIAYFGGNVLFYLVAGPPIAVPVRAVEGFFLGQGPTMLPGPANRSGATVNLIARLSQRETDWAERKVKPALGRWAEGYVTIRGTWCEPLNGETVRRLNRRLREATEQLQQSQASDEHP